MDDSAQHSPTAELAIDKIDKAELIRAFQQKMPGYDPAIVAQVICDLLEQKPTTLDGQILRLTINDQTANLASYNVVGGNLIQTTINVVVISVPKSQDPIRSERVPHREPPTAEHPGVVKPSHDRVRRIISLVGSFFIALMIPLRASNQFQASQQPSLQTMTGDVNIVIAEFTQLNQQIPNQWNDQLMKDLDSLYGMSGFSRVKIQTNPSFISSTEAAQQLAQATNAHMVIYGDAQSSSEGAVVTLRFYVIDPHRINIGELINGEHQIGAQLRLSEADLLAGHSLLNLPDALILIEFTKALVYLGLEGTTNLDAALASIDKALDVAEIHPNIKGKEVLLLFAAVITTEQCEIEVDDQTACFARAQSYLDAILQLNPAYGRAYLAKATIFYTQGNLYQAMDYFNQAKALPNQPFGSYIKEKAIFGIGSICILQLQYVQRRLDKNLTSNSEVTRLANCALQAYQTLINRYDPARNDPILQELTAWAYYWQGVVYVEADQISAAQWSFEQAKLLTTNADLQQRVQQRLTQGAAK